MTLPLPDGGGVCATPYLLLPPPLSTPRGGGGGVPAEYCASVLEVWS